ncbi:MAG TPA: aminotransferase class III-fold pyridoxal phosphate-dependent enzyme, partial [Petrotogaceae bacterium]|nr:aminotransferase class III-fold pyridoxal phosphate-dependent enzyme [Petrotogaceae bacterium]
GHCHPQVSAAFIDKISRYTHLSNYFLDEDCVYVADRLVAFSGKQGKVFFTNSGTEATEAALKAVKKSSTVGKNKILFFKNGFHGRTLGALSINGFETLTGQFMPLLENTVCLNINDCEELDRYMLENGQNTAAMFVEPIQGSGGVVPLTQKFAQKIEQYHKEYRFLLISDEVQAGLGRTGKIYSYQNYSLEPDIITLAKSLGAGLPLGAAVFLEESGSILKDPDHGSTFAPNPVALAGARVITDKISEIVKEVNEKSEYLRKKLKPLTGENIAEVRGIGLMLGAVMKRPVENLLKKGVDNFILLNLVKKSIIRLLPALNITFEQIDEMAEKLLIVLKE